MGKGEEKADEIMANEFSKNDLSPEGTHNRKLGPGIVEQPEEVAYLK